MTTRTIVFATSNPYKFKIAKDVLSDSPFKLLRKELGVPEIQDESVQKVAAFSARWVSSILKRPAVVSDGGCYIETLNGFPGPFVKYINQWLSAKDLLRLLQNKKNRQVIWKDCLAYCEPGKKPVTFISNFRGKIATKTGLNTYRKNYSWVDTLFIPIGHTKPLSELPTDAYLLFWSQNKKHDSWQRLLLYLKRQKSRSSN